MSVRQLAVGSLLFNLAYGIYHGALGLWSRSWWLITLGVYYILLSVTRFGVLLVGRKVRQKPSDGVFACRFTGALFLALSVVLAGMVILSTVKDRGVVFHEIVMITMALYTFTKITLAIISLVKARRNQPVTTVTLRHISFADALVSVLSLQRSMLVSFPGMTEPDVRLFNALTGAAVCVAVFLLGLHLIQREVKRDGKGQ